LCFLGYQWFIPIYALQPNSEQFIPAMKSCRKTYPPVYLYYLKSTGKTKIVKTLIDFLLSKMQK